MESTPFLPKCPNCGAWPMAVSDMENSVHSHVKFVCARCSTVANATVRKATLQRQTSNSLDG
jgi:hypothetical protein